MKSGKHIYQSGFITGLIGVGIGFLGFLALMIYGLVKKDAVIWGTGLGLTLLLLSVFLFILLSFLRIKSYENVKVLHGVIESKGFNKEDKVIFIRSGNESYSVPNLFFLKFDKDIGKECTFFLYGINAYILEIKEKEPVKEKTKVENKEETK